ncbi:MAG: rod shape-determining protein MreC [Lachnospiraceae bacterium]|nr:rod shape-determining protein MreC [Lachnospiraceae bacterium]MDD5854626.1 rod shape-determining protein MreC [Lachnospiraceae bacterium]
MNRRRNGFTLQSKYLLLILTGLCVLLMAITFMTDIFSGTLAEISSYVTIPFQKGISETGTYLSNRSDELVQIRDLIQQNKELQQQIDELTIENNNLTQEKYELNNLRSLYKLDQEYADYQKTGAKVIGKNSGNWFQSFTIDKGTKDGIKLNMNVMAESGLVGIVTEVGYNWARVTSIIDDSSNVSGMTLATGDNMIVSGNLELMSQNKISFSKLIDSNDQVKEGDKVVTSNISDKYLPGLLIGYITSIESDSNNLTHSGTITPAVDFEHMDEVLVILDLKQQTESEE